MYPEPSYPCSPFPHMKSYPESFTKAEWFEPAFTYLMNVLLCSSKYILFGPQYIGVL
jgi:hypothetical protein